MQTINSNYSRACKVRSPQPGLLYAYTKEPTEDTENYSLSPFNDSPDIEEGHTCLHHSAILLLLFLIGATETLTLQLDF